MCSGSKTNKHGYSYCNHGFPLMSGCKIKDAVSGKFIPSCLKEESHMGILPDNFDIIEYRKRMENYEPVKRGNDL